MLVRRIFIMFILAGLVIGCAGSAKKINNVTLGMTKPEVVEVMGEPDYSSVREGVEILNYKLTSNSLFTDAYIVRIKQGKVDLFGRRSDFGSLY